MTWLRNEPLSTDSAATSQPKLAANFSHIESVLGSSTLSAGITWAQGDLVYADSAQLLKNIAKATGNNLYLGNTGTNNNPSWTKVNLSDGATGTLPVGNGGTGATAAANAANGVVIVGADGYLADSLVDTTALKTTTGTVSISANGQVTLPGGEYAFFPQYKVDNATGDPIVCFGYDPSNTGYITQVGVFFYAAGGGTITFQSRYVTASGRDYWIFLCIDKNTKEIIYSYSAPDHPAYNNGGDFNKLPHPFLNYNPESHDIILLDNDTVTSLKIESNLTGENIIDLINDEYKVGDKDKPYVPLHSGKYINKDGKQVIEIVESIPDFIKCRSLVRLTEEEKKEKKNKIKNRLDDYLNKKNTLLNGLKNKLNLTDEEFNFLRR